MFPAGNLHAEIQLPVIAIVNTGNGLVRYGRPVWAIEQSTYLVADAVDENSFPSTVAAELRQPGQSFPHRAAMPEPSLFIPQRIIIETHCT